MTKKQIVVLIACATAGFVAGRAAWVLNKRRKNKTIVVGEFQAPDYVEGPNEN